MTQQADELKKRTKQFALDVIGFIRTLPTTDEGRAIGRQLLRSGPGVASNYRSACRARSRAEFVARIGIALEESDESALWFEVLTESGISRSTQAFLLLKEADELSAIFAASSITAKSALTRRVEVSSRQSAVGSRRSPIGNRQSAIGNRQSAIQSAI